MKLRPYQEEALKKMQWAMSLAGNELVVLPTGAGKSLIITQMARELNQDILILQPNVEILEQNKTKLAQYVSENEIGIYSASAGEKEIKKFTFAMIGSIYKIPEDFKHFKVAIVDEAHLVNNKNESSMLVSFFKRNPQMKVFGMTATPYRLYPSYQRLPNGYFSQFTSLKVITRTQPRFFDRIIYNINNHELVEQGFLCPLRYVDKTILEQELMPLNKSKTDFDLDKFENILEPKTPDIAEALKLAQDTHNSVLVFCSSIRQANALSAQFSQSRSVSSKTPNQEREQIIEDFKNGTIKMVFNVGILTTGFDMPSLDCIVLLRPTRSLILYYQMLGRGVRLAPNKSRCTVIDFTNTTQKLGKLESIKLEKINNLWNITTETNPYGWHGIELYKFQYKK